MISYNVGMIMVAVAGTKREERWRVWRALSKGKSLKTHCDWLVYVVNGVYLKRKRLYLVMSTNVLRFIISKESLRKNL